jgi:hypothetical protein
VKDEVYQKRQRRKTRSEQNSQRKSNADERSEKLKPGDYVRFRDMYCPVKYATKIALILDWADDGFNSKRAPRNKKVLYAIEPHLHDTIEECETYEGKLQEVVPVAEMEVIAEASR